MGWGVAFSDRLISFGKFSFISKFVFPLSLEGYYSCPTSSSVNECFSYTKELITSVSKISSISVGNIDALYPSSKVLTSIYQSALNMHLNNFLCHAEVLIS